MPTTLAYAKLGKRGAELVVRVRIPLDDPERDGNFGLQGYDEECIVRNLPNAGLARAWASRLAEQAQRQWPGCQVTDAEVHAFEWVDGSFEDYHRDEYVRHAEQRTTSIQYGHPSDGDWKWDPPAQPW